MKPTRYFLTEKCLQIRNFSKYIWLITVILKLIVTILFRPWQKNVYYIIIIFHYVGNYIIRFFKLKISEIILYGLVAVKAFEQYRNTLHLGLRNLYFDLFSNNWLWSFVIRYRAFETWGSNSQVGHVIKVSMTLLK